MKKLVLLILGFILGALAMYFYFHSDKNQENMDDTPIPKGIIKPDQIKTLTKAYDPRYNLINDSIFKGEKDGDNRSSWYSLEDLQNFITLAQKQAGDLGYTMDGIRIYPGAHQQEAGKPGYTTFLLVPTGYLNTSEGSMLSMQKGGGDDIDGGNGLNNGDNGKPPGSNYPQ
ncbi:hypothetical protein [Psychroserpens ponticola]|uniref:Uncharacterized protein n=1 Tax=Psychroserpens ponticola TaxID=2932268 RepID=A0ABY7RTJ2_9FLAO|nr:hypothetical protein [Psychroserpens ponticola]WCO00416.1 hypothetical protein MUN68_010075 [Psychroserpens ponticola]